MRITKKTTTIGAVAATAVIGATSPVWADSGSDSTTELSPSQQAAVISTLRAEIAKLKSEIKADEAALRAATKAARLQAHELHKARAAAVATRSHPATRTVPVSTPPALKSDRGDDEFASHRGKRCDHRHHGVRGDFGDRFGDDRDHHARGDFDDDQGDFDHHDHGEDWDDD